ncbi:MAG: hypothetical protein M5T61_13355 [Acidimicrobiia bacterium]|nr:hypothetical protein [Acidimicrobiia bacterium]
MGRPRSSRTALPLLSGADLGDVDIEGTPRRYRERGRDDRDGAEERRHQGRSGDGQLDRCPRVAREQIGQRCRQKPSDDNTERCGDRSTCEPVDEALEPDVSPDAQARAPNCPFDRQVTLAFEEQEAPDAPSQQEGDHRPEGTNDDQQASDLSRNVGAR